MGNVVISAEVPNVLTMPRAGVATLASIIDIPGHGGTPVLVYDRARGVGGPADTINSWFGMLIKNGWTLAPTGISRGRTVPGWKLALDRGQGVGEFFIGDKSTFLDSLPPLPPGWVELAARQREVLVMAGTGMRINKTGITAASALSGPGVATAIVEALEDAADRGTLLAGRVRISLAALPSRQPQTDLEAAAAGVAEALKEASEAESPTTAI